MHLLDWAYWFNTFWDVFDASWHAVVVALVVLAAHFLLRRHLPARWRFALWFLVLLRFTYPYGSFPAYPSRWSLFNFLPTTAHAGRILPETLRPPSYGTEPIQPGSHPVTLDPITWTPPPPPAIAWDHVLVVVWLTGMAAVTLRLALASLALRRILRRARPVTSHPALAILESACRTVGLRVSVRLLNCSDISSPAITGIMRPRLLVPPHLLETLSPAELRHVFLHECTHIRREDVVLNYWIALLSAIHWYNPVLWLLLPRIKSDRELACDEAVLAKGEPAAAYGHTLLKILETSAARSILIGAVGIIESKSFVKRRIRMIAAFRRKPGWIAFPALVLIVTLAAATLTSAVSKAAARQSNVSTAMPTSAPAPASTAPSLHSDQSYRWAYSVRYLISDAAMHEDRPLTADERAVADEIVNCIKTNVQAGAKYSITAVNGVLVIDSPHSVQLQIYNVLSTLLDARAEFPQPENAATRPTASTTRDAPSGFDVIRPDYRGYYDADRPSELDLLEWYPTGG